MGYVIRFLDAFLDLYRNHAVAASTRGAMVCRAMHPGDPRDRKVARVTSYHDRFAAQQGMNCESVADVSAQPNVRRSS
jgi:hypothetical protein